MKMETIEILLSTIVFGLLMVLLQTLKGIIPQMRPNRAKEVEFLTQTKSTSTTCSEKKFSTMPGKAIIAVCLRMVKQAPENPTL